MWKRTFARAQPREEGERVHREQRRERGGEPVRAVTLGRHDGEDAIAHGRSGADRARSERPSRGLAKRYARDMIDVTVTREDSASFLVTVRVTEGSSHTTHEVTVKRADHARLARPNEPVTKLVERSFEFLLEREPKESIMRSFDLMVIARYFPEYERTIR